MGTLDLNAVLRGAQLTVVGAVQALKNPDLFAYKHYRQAAIAVCAGIAIRVAIGLPIALVQRVIWLLSSFVNFNTAGWDAKVAESMHFFASSVLQLPYFLMTLMRYVAPTLDETFMNALQWVDKTYAQKHKAEAPHNHMYYQNLQLYSRQGSKADERYPVADATRVFLLRFARRGVISLVFYVLSYLPGVGPFVLPTASLYSFYNAVGPVPSLVVFFIGLFLPRRAMVVLLQSYFSSRSLMRELLEPYFTRIKFTKEQRRLWFRDREAVLFGFGVGFYWFTKVPVLNVLIYGVAEASTAYLITKITDPPPPPNEGADFAERQIHWSNQKNFLRVPLHKLDALNTVAGNHMLSPLKVGRPERKQSR